jgi:hypothetical protein
MLYFIYNLIKKQNHPKLLTELEKDEKSTH